MREYKLAYLPGFYKDLEHAAEYITVHLNNPQAALELVDDIEMAIQKRLPFAESFEQYHSQFDRKHPYYRIYVKNYVIYYVVIGEVMEVRRLLHERQEDGKV